MFSPSSFAKIKPLKINPSLTETYIMVMTTYICLGISTLFHASFALLFLHVLLIMCEDSTVSLKIISSWKNRLPVTMRL